MSPENGSRVCARRRLWASRCFAMGAVGTFFGFRFRLARQRPLDSYIGGLGFMAATETFTLPVLFTAWFLWYHRATIREEERFLNLEFGPRFWRYCRAVSRFLPMRSPRRCYLEPPRWNIDPASFRTSLLHAVWFIVGAVGGACDPRSTQQRGAESVADAVLVILPGGYRP